MVNNQLYNIRNETRMLTLTINIKYFNGGSNQCNERHKCTDIDIKAWKKKKQEKVEKEGRKKGKKEKEKGMYIRKGKMFQLPDDMTLYLEDLKESNDTVQIMISEFSKIMGSKIINCKILMQPYMLATKH